MKAVKHLPGKWSLLIFVALLAVIGLGLTAWQVPLPFGRQAAATPTASPYQTTTVRKGNLSSSASGSGTLVPAQSLDLDFATSGKVAQLNVQVGDHVIQGQVLAVEDGIDKLQLAVQNNQLALQTAQKTLDDLQANAAVTLAQADANQANAQKALADAQGGLHTKRDPTCDQNTTVKYYYQYAAAQAAVAQWEGYLDNPKTGYSHTYILQKLIPLRRNRDIQQANWQFCQGYTDQQIVQSQVTLQLAEAKLDQATKVYQTLKTNQGIDPVQLAIDEAAVKNAQLQLLKSQKDLAGATIVAPMDGTITAVNAAVGQTVGSSSSSQTSASASNGQASSSGSSSGNAGQSSASATQTPTNSTLLTIADLAHPLLQVNMDESDLGNFAPGCPAQVTFNALPDQTFQGVVTQVYPSLVSVQSVSMVQGLVSFPNNPPFAGQPVPQGLRASVIVTCQQAGSVLIVPVQALYEPAGQPAYVFILNQQNQPEKRPVVVGLKTSAFAEIRSGLNLGERVITSPLTGQ